MYKKIELFSKTNHKDLSLANMTSLDFAKDVKIIPLGLSEISKINSFLPVIISGGTENQFVAYCALSNQINFFSKEEYKYTYTPMFLKSYPFLMVDSYEENNEQRKLRAIAIDTESPLVGTNNPNPIFDEKGALTQFGARKIQLVQNFEKDRINASKLIKELKKYNLLDTREFAIKLENGDKKVLLSDFFVVNKQRLYELDDTILLSWAKNGWLYIIESHIHSIENINTLLQELIKK
jgi:putative transposase